MPSVPTRPSLAGAYSLGACRRGFALVAVLWVLAALGLVAVYVDGLVGSRVDRAMAAREGIARKLDRVGTYNTVVYLAVAGRTNHRALVLERRQRFTDDIAENEFLPAGDGELLLTGKTYAGLGDMHFSVQDETGLGALNLPHAPMFGAALEHLGVSPLGVRRLAARVRDYIDLDADLSVSGAESLAYRRRNLPPPPNWIMLAPLEIKRVFGAAEAIAPEQWEPLRGLVSTRSAGYNFNTMHPDVLAGLLRLPAEQVDAVLKARAGGPINRADQVASLTGRHLDISDEDILTAPSSFLRVAVWPKGGGARSVAGIQLTLQGDVVPWRTGYFYTETLTHAQSRQTERETEAPYLGEIDTTADDAARLATEVPTPATPLFGATFSDSD